MTETHCLRIIFAIWKYTDTFGVEGVVLGMEFYRKNLPWGGKFLGGESSRGKVTLGDLSELLYKTLFNCLIFFLPNFSCEDCLGDLSEEYFKRV